LLGNAGCGRISAKFDTKDIALLSTLLWTVPKAGKPRLPVRETFNEYRRSTRVPLKVIITVEGGAESQTCDGETIVVNLEGALITTAIGLRTGMRISIQVYVTGKRAAARIVYINPENPLHCGIELDEPRNIWGVHLPPNDWGE
jgi:hypothetical protein